MVLLLAGGGAALAGDMPASPRPLPNPLFVSPQSAAPAAGAPPQGGLAASLRPRSRPAALTARIATLSGGQDQGLDLASLMTEEPDPAPAPKGRAKAEKATKKGSVCGVNAIRGEKIAPIRAKVKGCGLSDGVRVTSVAGVRLSPAITVDCDTARALNTWVADVAQPAFGNDLVELKIAAHYICRSRNNVKGAKISEHGRGRAVDVAGFVLGSGKALSVAANYSKTMRRAHKGACGIFGTTLGPGSDGYHEDHLHLDTASYRGGPYCR
ncbi:MAG: extensin family protein [Paracoccaceae bacterium]